MRPVVAVVVRVTGGKEGRKRKKLVKEREEFTVAALPLVRSWVGGFEGGQANGECGGSRRRHRREGKKERTRYRGKKMGNLVFSRI
jgi:hypothetical protein